MLATVWDERFLEAVETANEFFDKFGPDPEIHMWLAVSHQRLGNLEDAEEHYEIALILFSEKFERIDAYLLSSLFFQEIGELERAREIALRGLQIEQKASKIRSGNEESFWATGIGFHALLQNTEEFLIDEALN